MERTFRVSYSGPEIIRDDFFFFFSLFLLAGGYDGI
jgi:hypothetical protein